MFVGNCLATCARKKGCARIARPAAPRPIPVASCERTRTPRKQQFLVAVVLNRGSRSGRAAGRRERTHARCRACGAEASRTHTKYRVHSMSGHSRKTGRESSDDSTLRCRSPAAACSTLGGPRTPVAGLMPSSDRRAHILRSPCDAQDDIFVAGAPRRGAARAARCSIVPQHCGRRSRPPTSDLRTNCTVSEPIACAAPPPPRCA